MREVATWIAKNLSFDQLFIRSKEQPITVTWKIKPRRQVWLTDSDLSGFKKLNQKELSAYELD